MVATLDNTLGMLFNSVVLTGLLQMWHYYRHYAAKDGWFLRCLVIGIFCVDTAQQGMYSASVYWYCVTTHGDPTALAVLDAKLAQQVMLIGILALTVQLFYCYRVFLLSRRNYFVAGFLTVVALGTFAVTTTYYGYTTKYTMFADLANIKSLSISINVTSAVMDVMISSSMVFFLHTSKTGFKRSNDVLNRLIVFTFNTGIPTSAAAIWSLIAINAWPDTFIYMLTFFIEGRLYTNCLMVTLNSRANLKSALSGSSGENYTMSSRDRSGQLPSGQRLNGSNAIAIRIDTTKQMDRPDEYKQQAHELESVDKV
ncbi:hypothetical protein BD626DRAFT_571228 [Schizophyllum amplum]|uniref:DUF6534 domain-containing protein n=1 Tax=Schizophyllum amplum TaxID=97359 RepID=A0A550BWI3_9AGAR|nr:hypothetical protein BD626DRAFT_575003 [Auriculariopsis ampla]TRM61186.1 hypothetical protein BD626DRAFT_571228 [Auriculariopsis ampla]